MCYICIWTGIWNAFLGLTEGYLETLAQMQKWNHVTAPAWLGRGTMGSKALPCSLAMLVERLGKRGSAYPTLQNWGRGSAASSQPLRLDKLFLGGLAKSGHLLQAVCGEHAEEL